MDTDFKVKRSTQLGTRVPQGFTFVSAGDHRVRLITFANQLQLASPLLAETTYPLSPLVKRSRALDLTSSVSCWVALR